jgi:hypothetical protein
MNRIFYSYFDFEREAKCFLERQSSVFSCLSSATGGSK